MADNPRTGFVFHPAYLKHDPGVAMIGWPPRPYPYDDQDPHVESPRRVSRIKELVDKSGLAQHLLEVSPYPAEIPDIERYHTADYIRRVLEISVVQGGGDAGEAALMGEGSFEIALLAAGGAMAAVDATLQGRTRNIYALLRPPGHHAVADKGMGFCIFNNVAVAAKHAKAVHNVDRILIVDWDVHHGHGTQAAFYSDPSVVFISLHQEGLYPFDSGTVGETGEGPGEGFTVNLPLPAGTGDMGYATAFEQVVIPIARQHQPDLLMVSSGLDPSRSDPLGRMVVSAEGFRTMTRLMLQTAEELCGGRLVIVHEGGYSESYAPYCGLAVIEELSGVKSAIEDPAAESVAGLRPSREVSLDTERALQEIREVQSRYWKL